MRYFILILCILSLPTILAEEERKPLKHRIIPLPFVNRGEGKYDWFGYTLLDSIHYKVSHATRRDKDTVIYDYESVLNGLKKLLLIRSDVTKERHIKRIFDYFGATHILAGEFFVEEKTVSVKLLLYAQRDGSVRRVAERSVVGRLDTLNKWLTEVAKQVSEALAEEGVEYEKDSLNGLPLDERFYGDYTKVLFYKRDEETYERAVEILTKLYKDGCRGAPVLFQLGWLSVQKALQTEDADEMLRFRSIAKKFFRDAGSADASFGRAFNSLGLILYAEAHYADAEIEFKKAVKADSKLPVAHFNLGNLYIKIRKFKRALEPLLIAYRLAPADAAVANALGCAYLELEKTDTAKKWYERAVELDEELVEAHLGLALLYDEEGRKRKAAEHYGRYLELGGKDEEGWIGLRLERIRKEILKGEKKEK